MRVDIEELAQAALDAGLPWDEVERTLVSADSTLAMDPRPESEVLARVQVWMDRYSQLPGVMGGVATTLAFEAVACKTSRPLLSQTKAAADLGVHRTLRWQGPGVHGDKARCGQEVRQSWDLGRRDEALQQLRIDSRW
jgi:hypothetical protein